MSHALSNPSTSVPAQAMKTHTMRTFPYLHESLLALLVVAVFVLAGLLEPRFVRPAVQLDLAGDAWPLALLALPMTMIVITGGIDLSVGATAALCAVITGMLMESGSPVPLAICGALAVGTLAGAINGALIAGLRVHPLIVTLATMAVFRGIALAATGGRTIQGFPRELKELAAGTMLGLPYPLWLLIAAATLTGLFLSRSPYGRFIYAIGHNETAARYSGVPVRAIKFALYTLAGFTAGVGAVLMTSRYGQAKADFANALELQVITAVVLGGVSIFGGRGHVVGVLLGVLLIHECQKFVPWHWRQTELNALVVGFLLIGSVLVNSLRLPRRR